MSTALQPRHEPQTLSPRAAQLLATHLPPPKAPFSPDEDPVTRTIAAFEALVANSLTVPEAAARLGVHTARVLQRLKQRSLYGVKIGRDWRLPAFQFTEHGEVPNIGKVLTRIDPEIHPVAVVTWITSPDPDFWIGNRNVSPVEWLRSGGNPDLAARLAATLGGSS